MMKEVSLFIPCIVDKFMPSVGESTALLMERMGFSPRCREDQTCCGQPAFSGGFDDQAREMARHFIRVFEEDEFIVSPSGSCVHMVCNGYLQLFRDEPEWLARAKSLGERVFELSQFMVDRQGITDVGAVFNGRAAYHESCKLSRGLGVAGQPRELIRNCSGTELVPMAEEDVCCGFGGEFAGDYPAISEQMLARKVDNFKSSGADILVVSEPGCLLNISGFLSRRNPQMKAVHLADFLTGNTASS